MAEGTLVEDTIGGQPAVFLGWLFHSERNIAERLSALSAGPLPWSGIDADRALPWVEARAGISLAPSQAAALRQALRAKVLVITGGPGVGKTTLVNSIIRILGAKGTAHPAGGTHRPGGQADELRRPGWRPGPCTGCWRSIPAPAASSGRRRTRWRATCWWWTKPRWSMSR